MAFDPEGTAILSKVYSDSPNAPQYRVSLMWKGEKLKIGLWRWTTKDGREMNDDHGAPQFQGPIKVDDYVAQGQQQQPPQPEQQNPSYNNVDNVNIPF